jgi:glycosyltransferase involved in cell wall biosynthesis
VVRVGVEGSYYLEPSVGVGQYVHGLWREFARGVPGLEPVLLLPGPRAALPETIAGEVVIEEPPRRFAAGKARKLWWEQVGVARAARRAGVALVHLTHFFSLPLRRDRPYLVTIHDLVPLLFPVYTNSRAMQWYLRLVCATAPRADLILTDSEHSARDITQHLGVPRERIRAIHLAADERYRPLPPDDPAIVAAREQYGLDGPFIFNVGGLDVRKNLAALLRAFALVRPQLPDRTRLVIGGAAHSGNPERYPDLRPLARELGIADATVFTGRISDEEKLALLNAAELYAYPSLYEGFGISPLEAMRCGTPVISSDRSSLPEVVGEGGLQVDPTPEKLGAAMAFVLQTPHELRELRRRALAQAARFSWARTAQETAAAYEEVLRNAGAPAAAGRRMRNGRKAVTSVGR